MKYSTFHLVQRIMIQARPYWLWITGILLLGLLSAPIALIKPMAIKLLIDSAFGSHPVPGFIRMLFPENFDFSFSAVVFISATLVIIITLIENLYSFISGLLETYTGEKLVLNFRMLLFNHIQRISLAYHDKKGTADSLYRLQWDTTAIRSLLLGSLPSLVSSFITLVSMIIVMFSIHRHFALITFCIIPPLFMLTRFSRKRIKRGWKKIKKDESLAMAVLHEVMGSLRVVKAFGQEDKEEKRFADQADKAIKEQLEMARFGSFYNFMVGLLFALGTALFIYLGARYVHAGQMTLGELTLVLAYLGQVFGPLQNIAKNINHLQSSILSIERVFELLDQEKEVIESTNPLPLPPIKGAFEFQNVGFSYEGNKPVLQDASFQIQAGKRVGIIGPTGAGKTTLISLLIRFYDPSSGRILLDGTDIKKFRLSDYRSQFSIVLQEPVLFSTTIAENIRYGRPDASQKEIIEAAKAANAHDFIMSNPDGYDAIVGERGMQLSGGERQRISLARAFIKNAPVLILDEPTSSIDIKTEALILAAIKKLMEGRTTFMITHRLDTLGSCDLILHLEDGKIAGLVHENDPDFLVKKKAAFL